MQLNELLQRLCEGEFEDINLGYTVDGLPMDQHYPKLVRHIDMGLLELHKRFPIRTRTVQLEQDESIKAYTLRSVFAQSNTGSTEPIKYILDDATAPFKDSEFLRIDEVKDAEGVTLPLNNAYDDTSVFTPTHNTLYVPEPEQGKVVTFTYRAAHGTLSTTDNPEDILVDLPYSHVEALLYYVANRVLAPTNIDASRDYLMKFESACNILEEFNLNNEDNTESQQFYNGGWV